MSECPTNFYYETKISIDSFFKNSFDFNRLVNFMLNLKKKTLEPDVNIKGVSSNYWTF